ncbi:RNA-binding domain-containing protein [Xylona heveae TC161]|uniref:RNA-binding domain-containing protein n=1 Tax=Xylona heveae (strain CBS 132557 / TC161) TaxID=1328760 RepID=A0A165JQK3_XYLHT|nr:RNA-binding domain-containing protein [Xylona heveae TC161]KZF26516.1 RNA-binding domain-containing protein [Xylona heveae TC161]
MSLGDFLNDESLGSWADEMEDMPLPAPAPSYGSERRGFGASTGFGAGFSDRGGFLPREQLPLPDKPPFTAHIGNLSFDATEGDITDFFMDCAVTNVRIVEDKIERRPKGFGYVEFGTLDGLKKALDLNNTQFQGRTIRISVAEPPKDRPDARELNDWTRKGPLPEIPRRGSDRGGFSGFEAGDRRRPFEAGDGKVRDFGNWERKGPPAPVLPTAPTKEAPRDRRESPSWGEGRSQEGSRPPRKEYEERAADRAPTAPELDNAWRARMRPDAPVSAPTPPKEASKEASTPTSPVAPAVRPKLQLQKRTVSEAEPAAPSTASSDSKASPFGAARPINTFAKEREIEEKRLQAQRQKKEQDEKAREEKRQAKEAAKAEKAAAAAAGQDEAEKPQPGNTFKALSKEEANAPAQEGSETQNGAIVDDKAVKPQETPQEGTWRRTSEPTAESLEEDGWSTVSKARNNRRGGNQGARAIAS